MKKLALGVGIILLLAVAWYLISPAFVVVESDEASPLDLEPEPTEMELEEEKVEVVMDEVIPIKPKILAQGNFEEHAHEVEGKALLIEGEKTILRFEDFNTINGPDLRIYLSTDLTNNDFVEVGKIKATKGNVNYDVPNDIDTNKYNNVLVWCKPFGVLFSAATLS